MFDVSAVFTQVYDAMMEKFERLSAMNDHNVYNQQIYDMYLDCLILAERVLTRSNQIDDMTLETHIYVCTLMNGLIDGETDLMKEGPTSYNRPEHYLILCQVRAELQQKLAMTDEQAA
ncbi:hypothetical protein [Limosilactobacillus mucosae]|uniref:Uncharacterized protein n=1 Tax=Limosilactobacillus mucosae TaxID=97478 RepID=A0AAJ1HM57_LIMMU|nr:hypothetical protein [Limosilactobacillus mucosae]MDC2826943.1 hypothetical protein [Limosilactobacillus mucosae]MDC2834642.1 hypothetical protein [Limosilactobacillus mucosae]